MTFARYLGYKLKNSTLRTVIFTLISLAIALNQLMESNHASYIPFEGDFDHRETNLYVLCILMCVLATVIPMLETAAFKSRRNLDTLYSFPLRREKLALAHYLSGFIQLVFVYSVTFFVSYIWLALNTDWYNLSWMMQYYIFSLFLGWVMYSVFIFLFGEGNTVADGVVFSIFWIFTAYAVIYTVYLVLDDIYPDGDMREFIRVIKRARDQGLVYSPIADLTEMFRKLIEVNRQSGYLDLSKYKYELTSFVLWGLAGIGAGFGYFRTMVRKGAHKAGEISNSWFGYKLLIPLYGFVAAIGFELEGVGLILMLSAMVIGYTVYRRSFKFKISDYVMIAAAFIVACFVDR